MQKPFGRGGRSRSVRQTAFQTRRSFAETRAKTQHQTNFNLTTDFRNTGKPRSRTRTAKNTTRRKSSEGSAFWKNLLRRYCRVRRLPDNSYTTLAAELVLWSWRRDSNPRPSDYKSDALPTELRQQLGKGAPPRKLIPRIPSRCPGQLYKVPQRKL